jgi:hypothetical protein
VDGSGQTRLTALQILQEALDAFFLFDCSESIFWRIFDEL